MEDVVMELCVEEVVLGQVVGGGGLARVLV